MNILAFCKIWKKVIKFINASIWEKLDLSAKQNTVWEKMIKNSGCTGRNYYSFQEKDNKGAAEVQVASAASILLKIYIQKIIQNRYTDTPNHF